MIRRLLLFACAHVQGIARVALFACCSSVLCVAAGENGRLPEMNGYELSLSHPSIEQPLGAGSVSQAAKFVQVEITQVSNPARIPVSFTVAFRDQRGERADLGSFSLFPPDNPGRFIVATHDKVHERGTLIVTLVPLEAVPPGESVRVQVKPLVLVSG